MRSPWHKWLYKGRHRRPEPEPQQPSEQGENPDADH